MSGTTGVSWLLTDHLGSVRDITNSLGALVDHIDYTAFGTVSLETTASLGGRLKYAGYEFDSETSLYFDKARTYDPATGRFTGDRNVKIGQTCC